jgi:hypothetical protein
MKFLMYLYSVFLVFPALCAAVKNKPKGEGVHKIVMHTPVFECARIQSYAPDASCTVASQKCWRTKQVLDDIQIVSQEVVRIVLAYLPVVKQLIMRRDDDVENPLKLLYWEHVGGPTCLQVRTILRRETPFDINIHYRDKDNRHFLDGPPYERDKYVLQASKNYRITAIQDCRQPCYQLYAVLKPHCGNRPMHKYML